MIAVTDQNIRRFSASLWRVCDPRRLLLLFPPGTSLESRRVFYYEQVRLADQQLWVLPPYHEFLHEALAATGGGHLPG